MEVTESVRSSRMQLNASNMSQNNVNDASE